MSNCERINSFPGHENTQYFMYLVHLLTFSSLGAGYAEWLYSKEQSMKKKGGGEITLQWRNLTNATWARWSISTSMAMSRWPYAPLVGECAASPLWPSSATPLATSLTTRKTPDKSRLEDGLRNTSSVVFETIKVITNEARQKNCNSLGEPKKVKWLSVMGCPGRDHATEKEHQARARET